MAIKKDVLLKIIEESFPESDIEIKDLAGDDNHYAAVVKSKMFLGKTKIQQHKLVYDALEGRMGGILHALSLTTIIEN